jgi:hypothetical protein
MGTVRLAVKDLVSMGSIVTVGDPATDADGEPVRRGAAWLLIQVGAATLILGLALLVRAALGGGSGTMPLWIWVPALLLVLPFVGHVFARPVRLVAGAAKAHSVARAKSDHADAMTLANILRTDSHAHRKMPADTDLAQAIAVLARAAQDAI